MVGGNEAYFDVKCQLVEYYKCKTEAHFERLYHVLHELDVLRLTPNAVPKFRPVMYPFLYAKKTYHEHALRTAAKTMLQTIYETVSHACESPKQPLDPLMSFLSLLEERYLPRIYTINYDDFFEQAGTDGYFSGFIRPANGCYLFDPGAYWREWDKSGCFHLHGSVHMGFPNPASGDTEIGEIAWFPSRADALQHFAFTGSGIDRMDGTDLMRSAIVTGLDKLGRIQQSPFASYYSGLAREVMEANAIFVIGSGLADLHLNAWLNTVRRFKPHVPILYVGYWSGDVSDFYSKIRFERGDLELSLFHDLKIDLTKIPESDFKMFDGWTIDTNKKAAVWADGFQSFLNAPDALKTVLTRLGTAS